jgi:sugar-specific transcriptional regulator TrmB
MLNNNDIKTNALVKLGLSRDEARVYVALLEGASTHLKLARKTGINRTKVYRIADQLEKRSLIYSQTDDRGTFLVASNPETLEVELITREEEVKQHRLVFNQLLPELQQIKDSTKRDDFVISTYDGVKGFRQMLWHELKAKEDVLVLGNGPIQDLASSMSWAEKHRQMTIEAGCRIREIVNRSSSESGFTKLGEFMDNYEERQIDPNVIDINQQISIYNDTVATYSLKNGSRVGYEVTNHSNAIMMRQIFEHYWQLATPSGKVALMK